MCRNIRVLHHFAPPTTEAEIRAAALQYVRKVGGIARVSQADEVVVNIAVNEIAAATRRFLDGLTVRGEARTREGERDKAKMKWKMREAKMAH